MSSRLRTHPRRVARLKASLDRLYAEFDHPNAATDPVSFVRRYRDPGDREVVGFVAAALAFGRVASVMASIEHALSLVGPRPAHFVRSFDPAAQRRRFAPFVHRWTRGVDLLALLWTLRDMLERAGTLEAFFLEGVHAAAPDVKGALETFATRAARVDLQSITGARRRTPGVGYFFANPASGSACKRLNLFLRWMVRRDAIDLGAWSRLSAAKLVIPLDTHVVRVGRCLGLTQRRSPGWPMAADITASLRELDPEDPVKYDFALCHLGMMNRCGFNRAHRDVNCPLRGLCRPRAGRQTASPSPSVRQ